MTDALTDLTDLQRASLLGLRLRALDVRLPTPILNDQASLQAARDIGLNLDQPKIAQAVVAVHAVRTKTLDSIVRRFIAENPEAVVLDLGCGLDPRRHRCTPPAGVDWYDLDYPPVIELRQRFLPDADHHVAVEIGAPGWLDTLPADRPAIVVTDGLMAFLTDQAFQDMARALTARFRRGQFAFNAYSRLAMRNSRRMRSGPLWTAPTVGEGIDDPREPESWNARLRLIEQLHIALAPEVDLFPPLLRTVTRFSARSKRLLRHSDRVVRYRFGPKS